MSSKRRLLIFRCSAWFCVFLIAYLSLIPQDLEMRTPAPQVSNAWHLSRQGQRNKFGTGLTPGPISDGDEHWITAQTSSAATASRSHQIIPRFSGLGGGYGFGMSLRCALKLATISNNRGIQTAILDTVPRSDPSVWDHISPHTPSSSRTGMPLWAIPSKEAVNSHCARAPTCYYFSENPDAAARSVPCARTLA
jgi:hypothetical protein